MRRVLSVAALVVVAAGAGAALGGCGNSAPTPYDSVQSYLSVLAEGDYTKACAMLTGGARHALQARLRHRSCRAIYQHCLPSDALALKHDQSQLLYAEVRPVVHGRHAVVDTSGTSVAREIRRVSLTERRGRWVITAPGQALRRCRIRRLRS
jgi:hypothetical protein